VLPLLKLLESQRVVYGSLLCCGLSSVIGRLTAIVKNMKQTKTHVRYYIYRKETYTDEITYREQTGNWVKDFERANLWVSREFVEKKSHELLNSIPVRYLLFIGSVEVTVIN
jgi:hypothetical protein